MDIREKLVELLREGATEYIHPNIVDEIADHLLANGVTVQEWMPVTDRLPEDGKRVLALIGTKGCDHTWAVVDTFNGGDWCAFPAKYVTHWMPLPTPPKGE